MIQVYTEKKTIVKTHVLNEKARPRETLRKEVVSLGFYSNKTNDTLHKVCENVIVGYIL